MFAPCNTCASARACGGKSSGKQTGDLCQQPDNAYVMATRQPVLS